MDSVSVSFGDGQPQKIELNGLLPGKSRTISTVYQTGSSVENVNYTIASETLTQTGTVHLDYPDLDILSTITVDEVDGKRSFVVNLTDKAAAALYQSDRRLVLGVFADSSFETGVDGKFFEGGNEGQPYTICLLYTSPSPRD